MRDYPQMIAATGRVEPCHDGSGRARRPDGIRHAAGRYVWEWPNYPQYYIPRRGRAPRVLVDEGHARRAARPAELHGLRVGGAAPPGRGARYAQHRSTASPAPSGSTGTRSTPGTRRTSRSSCTRATRTPVSTRCARRGSVRVELDGVRARRVAGAGDGVRDRVCRPATTSTAPRWTSRTWCATRHRHRLPVQGRHQRLLVGPRRRTRCTPTSPGPTTSRPAQLLPIAGLVAFYNEKVDIFLDGVELDRPVTHFVKAASTDPTVLKGARASCKRMPPGEIM